MEIQQASSTPAQVHSAYKRLNSIYKTLFTTTVLAALVAAIYGFTLSDNLPTGCSFICISPRSGAFILTVTISGIVLGFLFATYFWLLAMLFVKQKYNLSHIRVLYIVLVQALIVAFIWYFMSLLHY